MELLVRILAVCLILKGVMGYESGAPRSACATLMPGHHHPPTQPQTTPSPYKLAVDSSTYAPGQPVTVSISWDEATGSPPSGLLLQARRESDGAPVGQFNPQDIPDGTRIFPCGSESQDSLTHTSGAPFPASPLQATWFPPTSPAGDIRFHATVLRDYATYWLGLKSEVMSPTTTSTATTTTTSTVSAATATAAATTTTAAATTTTAAATTTTAGTTPGSTTNVIMDSTTQTDSPTPQDHTHSSKDAHSQPDTTDVSGTTSDIPEVTSTGGNGVESVAGAKTLMKILVSLGTAVAWLLAM